MCPWLCPCRITGVVWATSLCLEWGWGLRMGNAFVPGGSVPLQPCILEYLCHPQGQSGSTVLLMLLPGLCGHPGQCCVGEEAQGTLVLCPRPLRVPRAPWHCVL